MRRETGSSALALALGLALVSWSSAAFADANQSLSAGAGGGNVSVFSDAFKVERTQVVAGTLRYTKQLTSRWSGTGLYVNCLGGMFSGYNLGLVYDSKSVNQATGDLTGMGVREVESVPKWLVRATLTGGVWQYLNTLTKTNPRPGADKKAPVSAVLYGITIGAQVHRFLDESKSISLEALNVSTFAQSFSANAMLISLGFNFYY